MTYELQDGDKLVQWPPMLREMGFGEEAIEALTLNLRWKEIVSVVEDHTRMVVTLEQEITRLKARIDDAKG